MFGTNKILFIRSENHLINNNYDYLAIDILLAIDAWHINTMIIDIFFICYYLSGFISANYLLAEWCFKVKSNQL